MILNTKLVHQHVSNQHIKNILFYTNTIQANKLNSYASCLLCLTINATSTDSIGSLLS